MSEEFKRTGIFATKEEIATVKDMFSAPMIMVGSFWPPSPWAEIDRLSVAHGMPQTDTQRGMDLRTGEFLDFAGVKK